MPRRKIDDARATGIRTREIIAARRGPLDAVWTESNPSVSTLSNWRDDIWHLDNDRGASEHVSVYFTQVDARFAEAARRLVWTRLTDCRHRTEHVLETVVDHAGGLAYVLNGLPASKRTLSAIGQAEYDAFETHLREDVEDGLFDRLPTAHEPDADPSVKAVGRVLNAWTMLIEQSQSLGDAGLDALPAGAVRPLKAAAVARRITQDETRNTPPLPQEVARLVVTAAERMLPAAEEVVERLAEVERVRAAMRAGVPAAIAVPEIDWDETEDGSPWRTKARPTRGDTRAYLLEVRGALRDVTGALLVLQFALATRRMGEALSTPAGRDEATGLPAAIKARRSSSGMFDLFYVRGKLTKQQPEPRDETWLIGSRIVMDGEPADAESPLGVRVVDVLERLHRPFRELSDDPKVNASLITSFVGMPTRGFAIAPADGHFARRVMKAWLASPSLDWESLPDVGADGVDLRPYKTTSGGAIRTTQWRKTVATLMMTIDPRLILPLSRHLKHFSDAITEDDYVSGDPTFLEDVRDASAEQTARLLYEIVRGERTAHGPMADRLRSNSPDIEKVVAGLDRTKSIAALRSWSLERGVSMFVLGPGKCFMPLMPTQALCHRIARTVSWTATRPSAEGRSDKACNACQCRLTDGDHGDFWTRAFVKDRSVWLEAERDGHGRLYHAALARSEHAALELKRLGLPIPNDGDLL